jgi:regulator of sigma E protease
MRDVANLLLYVVGISGMFLLLIAPHEGGHFLFAKIFKVRVIEFSIGAGTKLWSVTRNGTLYAIRAIPIIGYVRMGGMEAGDFEAPNGFHTKAAWQRIVILAAGPAANFLVAMLLFTGLTLTQLNSVPGKVGAVLPNSPAASAGFQPGDRVTTVNGKQITSPDQLKKAETSAPGATLVIGGVHPNGHPFDYVVVPNCDSNPKTGLFTSCQIGLGIDRIITVQSAIGDGVTFPFVAVGATVNGLWSLITGAVPGGLLGPNGLTGPVGIADVAAGAVSQGPGTYFFLVALLSVALGFTNLLPFLVLDGGRIVVVVIEALRRRPFDRTAELNLQRWGLAALMAAAAVITILDIERIATGQFPGLH